MGLDVRELVRYPISLPAGAIGLIGFKTLIVVAAARFFELSWPAALETGFLSGPGGEFAFVAVGLAAKLGLVTKEAASFTFALTSLTMALIPLLAIVAQRLTHHFERRVDLPPDLMLAPIASGKHAIVVGYGRVGNSFIVNEGAPDLFPVMSLVKEWFTRRERGQSRAFALNAIFSYNTLKILYLLSLTNCPLNSI
jgi:hypothetical protein